MCTVWCVVACVVCWSVVVWRVLSALCELLYVACCALIIVGCVLLCALCAVCVVVRGCLLFDF